MKTIHIVTLAFVGASILLAALDTAVYLHKKRKGGKTDTENQNVEICALCGGHMESESGRAYCDECGRKWGNGKDD